MSSQRFIHTVLSLVLFSGVALLGILAAVFGGLVSNLLQTRTNPASETLFFFISMISIAIFVIILVAIFRYIYLLGAINADWVELIGKALLIGTTSFCLTVFLTYYYQKFYGHGFSVQLLFYMAVSMIPLLVAVMGYEWLWSTTLRIQARVYQILDEILPKNPRVDERMIANRYTESFGGDDPILSPSIRWAMAQYVIENENPDAVPGDSYLALEGNPDIWSIIPNGSTKIETVDKSVPIEISREDQQWLFMGKWLSTHDEMYYFLLVELAKEPGGLLPGVWDNLKLHLDQLRRLASETGKLSSDDHLLMDRLDAILSLKPAMTRTEPALLPKSTASDRFELDEQLSIADKWLNQGNLSAYQSLAYKADSPQGLLPETWKLIQDRHDELRKQFAVYKSFTPKERELFINIVAILEKRRKQKSLQVA